MRPSSYFSGVDVIFSTEMPLSQRVFVLFAKPNGSWRMVETTNKVDLRQKSTVYGVRFRKYGQVVFFCVVDVILGMPVSLRVFKLRAQTKRISLFAATTDKVALTIQAQQ